MAESELDRIRQDIAELKLANTESHKEFYDRLNALERTESSISTTLDVIQKTLEGLAADVKELKDKPGKKWEGLAATLLAAIGAGIVGFFLSKILGA